jgi:murein DD-endopeptidase MepM/ murein hydrolase activator NlpD
MSVYDTEENKDTQTLPSDDDLRSLSGISEKDEAGYEDSAKKDLASKENDASSAKKSSPKSDEESKLNSLYKPNLSKTSGKRKFKLNKKQGGGIAGTIIGIALLWTGMTTSGPLQFIHFGQLIQAFHFSSQEDDSSNRATKLIKWMYTKDVTRTRLGVVAGIHAQNIELKLNRNGFKTVYSKETGTFKGYEFDAKAAKEGAFTDLKSDPATKVAEKIKAGLGATNATVGKNGKIFVPAEGLSNRQHRQLLKNTYDVSNTKPRIIAAIEKRLLIKRANLGYNPLTRLDNRINEKAVASLKKIAAARKARLTGTAEPAKVTAQPGKDSAGKTDPAAANASTEGQRVTDGVRNGGKLPATGGKITLGGAAIVGVLCIVKSVAANVDDTKQLNAVIPAINAANEVVSVPSKAQDGGDIDLTALGEYSKSLYSKENGSWAGANSVQYAQGKTQQGKTLPDELNPNPSDSVATDFFNTPGIKQVTDYACPIIENPVFAIITAIPAAATSIATYAAMSKFIPWIESVLSGGGPVDLSEAKYAGGIYGEAAFVGGRLMANETASAMGGRVLSNSEELALSSEIKDSEKTSDTRSIADKIFNPYKYDTPAAKAIDSINPNDISGTVAKLPKQLFKAAFTPVQILSKHAGAVNQRNPSDVFYGIPKVGFAPGTLDKYENPYANANKAADILMGPEADKYKELLKTCNKITVDTTNNVLDFGTEDSFITDYTKLPAECRNDSDPKLEIVRVAALDTTTMKALVCLDYDDAKSCADLGLGDAPANNTTTTPQATTGWTWPVRKEDLNNPSGAGLNQCWLHSHTKADGSSGYHAALDIGVRYKPVYAANAGKVIKKANDKYATLIIQHDGGFYSVYEHMSSITVKEGDSVTSGQQIGISGEVGAPGAAHLHFGISTNATGDNWGTYANPWYTINPLDFLPNDYSPALLKDDNTGSCLTKDISSRSDFGFAIYKIKGQYAAYK